MRPTNNSDRRKVTAWNAGRLVWTLGKDSPHNAANRVYTSIALQYMLLSTRPQTNMLPISGSADYFPLWMNRALKDDRISVRNQDAVR